MAEHMTEEFNLDRLAAQAGLSKFHFHRLFKSATGVAPLQYHINLRMNLARRMAPRNKEERRGRCTRRGLRQSQPFRAPFPPGNRPFPERLPSQALASRLNFHPTRVAGLPRASFTRAFEQYQNRWSKTGCDGHAHAG